jgi:hypothetical protein
MASANELDEIRGLARTFEYDRYLTALLMPRRHREALILLAAFAGELRRVPGLVTDPMMGAIRLQWWRDTFEAAAGRGAADKASGNPLADAVVAVVREHELPWGLIHGLIDAAEADLDLAPFNEAAETRQLLIKSESALFELAGRVAGARPGRAVWTDAGLAYGAFRCAHAYEARRRTGRQAWLAREIADPARDDGAAGRRWFEDLARTALARLDEKRSGLDTMTRRVLLPLAIIEPSFRSSSRSAGPSAVELAGPSPLWRAGRLWWAHWRGGY